jgi:serine/threonine-protein kinase
MIGSRLGKWIIDRELGRGGMGRVFLAHEESAGQLAAVKVLAIELAQEIGFLQRFQREIDVLGQLSHPNIVRLYESGAEDGQHFFAMEYVEGESFEQVLHREGRVPWQEVLDAALQICPALKHAHDRGIIHRDLKPPNLLRTPAGVIKLTDFGIAKVFAAQQLTTTGGVVGTAEYLSPEQAAGKIANKRSDLYCLGAVLYTLLTGRTPFEGRSAADVLHKHLYGQFERPQRLVAEIPHDLEAIVCQLLEKDPARRPADCLVLHRQLDSVRRKLERKSQRTVLIKSSQPTVDDQVKQPLDVDLPGPATLMSQLMRQELEQQKRGNVLSQWLNRPWVLLPLFLLCVGLIVWRLWPESRPSADWLFERGAALMASENPADWDKAWSEYLEPLNLTYPDHVYEREVEAFAQKREDHAAQRRALAGLPETVPASAAQRFYQRGLRLCQQGDGDAARQIWQNVVRTFRHVDSERRWVSLSEEALRELNERTVPSKAADDSVRKALQQARQLRDQGQRQEAEAIWKGLEALYRDDPSAEEVLREVERDRKP